MKIVLSVVLAIFIAGCSEEKSSQTNVVQTNGEPAVKEAVKQGTPVEQTKVEEVVQKAAHEVEESKVVKKVEEVKKVVATAPVVEKTPSVDGAKLFTTCASCHGTQAEKKALGKSRIIKGWDEAKIITALHGYKDGTYGGQMKAIMKGQADKLSDADIKALAKYISKL